MPGVGIGAAYSHSAAFLSLRELVSASRETIMQKGLSSSVVDNCDCREALATENCNYQKYISSLLGNILQKILINFLESFLL